MRSNKLDNARRSETKERIHVKRGAVRRRAGCPAKRSRQGELEFRSWGGARKGAGRKPKGERAMLPHRAGPGHKPRFPVLVTTRLCPGLASLRRPGEAARIRAALASVNEIAGEGSGAGKPAGAQKSGKGTAHFQVVHHSIQSNHLHLIVEAEDRRALTRGVQGLLVRIARALNRYWVRRGTVFADRFHERELRNPRQVRNALVYVLQNLRKHGIQLAGPDPYSSGPEFEGWISGRATLRETRAGARPSRMGGDALPEFQRVRRAMRVSVRGAKTWLLGVGWMRHGPIDPRESPLRR
jgi:REP element-mobilizing transposase RayT